MGDEAKTFDQRMTERLAKEYAEEAAQSANPVLETAVAESDTDGTPDDSMESEVSEDGALAVDETEETESDIDDTPEDVESEVVDYEQRYKETQAAFTEKSQEVSRLKSEVSESMAEITGARLDLQDSLETAEQTAQFWANQANGDFQRLQQMNVQQMTQEQYGQWQNAVTQAGQRAQMMQNALQQTQKQAKEAREKATLREAQIARAHLTRSIENFDEAYPEIGKYAAARGVNPRVFQEITDPGLIEILYESMQGSKAPDIIETTKQMKAKVPKSRLSTNRPRDAKGKFKKAEQAFRESTNPKQRLSAWEEKTRLRLLAEKRR